MHAYVSDETSVTLRHIGFQPVAGYLVPHKTGRHPSLTGEDGGIGIDMYPACGDYPVHSPYPYHASLFRNDVDRALGLIEIDFVRVDGELVVTQFQHRVEIPRDPARLRELAQSGIIGDRRSVVAPDFDFEFSVRVFQPEIAFVRERMDRQAGRQRLGQD
jgi:hypothetical protein